MFRETRQTSITVTIARGALEAIFDECDQYDSHETGGRLIGTYSKERDRLEVKLLGVIGPGPEARRSATSFFQDGEHQERIFRQIEEDHPEVEHLGNWHTHHCNGLATLSTGDHDTYHRIVNHKKHNTDFFYALLVVRKNPRGNPRYQTKHYFFHRNRERVDEVHTNQVRIVDIPLWSSGSARSAVATHKANNLVEAAHSPHAQRAKDQEFLSEFFPHLSALVSKRLGALYWKGPVVLIDGSRAEMLILENQADGDQGYSITISNPEPRFSEVLELYSGRTFQSARQAVMQLRDNLNHLLYQHRGSE
jgi:hypothetical protein